MNTAQPRTVPVSGGSANQSTSEYEINQLNLAMRQTPWYQQFFAQRGLNPNSVKLNEQQRNELTGVANRNGYQLGARMKIDEAGNINQRGGFAGMPTWAKVAIAAAPVAGAMLIPGVREATIGQIGGIFGGGTKGVVTGSGLSWGAQSVPAATTAATNIGSIAVPTATKVATAAAKGIGMKDILLASASPAIGMAGNYFANRANANAQRDAATAQTNSANYAADLQSKSAEEQLAFLREQDALSRKEKAETDARNFGIYQEERDYGRGNYAAREARLQPYRNLGLGAIGQLGRPIQNIPQGSIGARMGGR